MPGREDSVKDPESEDKSGGLPLIIYDELAPAAQAKLVTRVASVVQSLGYGRVVGEPLPEGHPDAGARVSVRGYLEEGCGRRGPLDEYTLGEKDCIRAVLQQYNVRALRHPILSAIKRRVEKDEARVPAPDVVGRVENEAHAAGPGEPLSPGPLPPTEPKAVPASQSRPVAAAESGLEAEEKEDPASYSRSRWRVRPPSKAPKRQSPTRSRVLSEAVTPEPPWARREKGPAKGRPALRAARNFLVAGIIAIAVGTVALTPSIGGPESHDQLLMATAAIIAAVLSFAASGAAILLDVEL